MTQRDRKQLQKAYDLLKSDDGWEEGARIIRKLLGYSDKMYRILDAAETVTLDELMMRPAENSDFEFKMP